MQGRAEPAVERERAAAERLPKRERMEEEGEWANSAEAFAARALE